MAAGWTSYNLDSSPNSGLAAPFEASDGNMWGTSSISSPSVGTWNFHQCTPLGVVTSTGGGGTEPVGGITNFGTDLTYLYCYHVDGYPRGYMHQINIAAVTSTQALINLTGGQNAGGLAMITTTSMVYVVEGNGGQPGAGFVSPWNNLVNSGGPGTGMGGYSYPHYDGTQVWAPINGSASIDAVPPTASGIFAGGYPRYTLAATFGGFFGAASSSQQPQTGFDGTFIYMAAVGPSGGVIIFNTLTHTSTVVGTGTVFGNCYYSANLHKVVMDDSAFNVYTMDPGGGPISQNLGQPATGNTPLGFGDGPGRTLWAAGNATAGYFFYKAGPFGQVVILPYRERRRGVVLPTRDEVRQVRRSRELLAA